MQNLARASSLTIIYISTLASHMAGITRDESDGFAARGCLRCQTQDPDPFGFYLLSSRASPCCSDSIAVYACALRADAKLVV